MTTMISTSFQRLKKILVVEDDLGVREVLVDYLGLLGLQPMEASNGKEAIAILQSAAIDLLITDFRMPQMDGVALLAWCREQGVHAPVIFVSGEVDLLPREKIALGDCCAALLLKPFQLEAFTAALEAADQRTHHKDCVHAPRAEQRP